MDFPYDARTVEVRERVEAFPTEWVWARARTLRLADGPDEVHRSSLAKREPRRGS
ncbi:hypothetical protein B0E53_03147 [Micromonospora sp. MH33]|uniref:hypothetical protein n=1 Tax=Micromonospora sp. MH33 TaxID=1945509 RepID=UPI000D2D7BC8|nr:hypothetical protein [Micromonospora sp. MH33]PSK64909.1 hypothetical protein B0E53_03147 [Micromonospora sp. MH33]